MYFLLTLASLNLKCEFIFHRIEFQYLILYIESNLPSSIQNYGNSNLLFDEKYKHTVQILGLCLPISVRDIIDLPMDEFNDLLSKHELTEEQLTLCREIRRRGKNKVYWMKSLNQYSVLII